MQTDLELLHDGHGWLLELTNESGEPVRIRIDHEQKEILENAGVPYYADK